MKQEFSHPVLKVTLMLIVMFALVLISEAVAPVCKAAELGKLDKGVQPITIRYYITPSERSEIEQAVMAESGSEPFEGQMAVAQCILTASEKDGIRPTEVLIKYQYTPVRKDPTVSVRDAVRAVFDRGEVITSEPIIYFYAPALCRSEWHESQQYVLTIANHKFFKLKEN